MTIVKATVAAAITIDHSQIDDALADFIHRELTFANPKIGELIRMGYSTWRVPRQIVCYKKLKYTYVLPIGFGSKLTSFLKNRGDELQIDDHRVTVPVSPITVKFHLKTEQTAAIERLLKLNRGILEAKPGFGKTMVGIATVARRQQKTLIIVHTRALLEQWQKRLLEYTDLSKDELGLIGEGKWKIGPRVTIASYQTILSRGTKSLQREFGYVIVDECHHVPANTFAKVVRDLSARYALGLTATPFRKDKLDKLMTFYLGKIISSQPNNSNRLINEDNLSEESSEALTTKPNQVLTNVIWRHTDFYVPQAELKEFTELGTMLSVDPARLKLVVNDALTAYHQGRQILVLSERVGHAEAIYQQLLKQAPSLKIALVTGQMKKNDRAQLFDAIKNNQYQLMVATGGVVGEGFDWPQLDALFLTFPFSWRGKLIQYVGRVQRAHPGKTTAIVYDYLDTNLSIFKAMARKRAQAYLDLGVNS